LNAAPGPSIPPSPPEPLELPELLPLELPELLPLELPLLLPELLPLELPECPPSGPLLDPPLLLHAPTASAPVRPTARIARVE
jgi:hypothetical protein